jgi:acetyl-CoA carboxylase biotin carboxyl carrier protein
MDLDEITQILQLMDENGLAEFELEREGFRVALRKAGAALPTMAAMPVPQAPPPAVTAAMPGAAHLGAETEVVSTVTINSPMVGTFYVAPSPEAPPFVGVGDPVSGDTVVCILEAMKVMNEIKAEVEGTIVEVLVENAEPVEYGEPLFRVALA